MKKPKFYISFRILKSTNFTFKMKFYYIKRLLWKDKFNTPRAEIIPQLLTSWLWFQVDIIRGSDDDWEWWLWVTKYCDNDIEKAIRTWPWKKWKNEKYEIYNPNLTYNTKYKHKNQ